jgi:hypothetical protein
MKESDPDPLVRVTDPGIWIRTKMSRIPNTAPNTELVFVNLLRNPGIESQPGGPVRQSYFSCRPPRLHRLTESIPGLLERLQIRAQDIKFMDMNSVLLSL